MCHHIPPGSTAVSRTGSICIPLYDYNVLSLNALFTVHLFFVFLNKITRDECSSRQTSLSQNIQTEPYWNWVLFREMKNLVKNLPDPYSEALWTNFRLITFSAKPFPCSEEVLWHGSGHCWTFIFPSSICLFHVWLSAFPCLLFHLSAFSMFGLAGKYAPQWLVACLLRGKLSLLTVRQLPAACTIYRRGTNATMQDLHKWNRKVANKII